MRALEVQCVWIIAWLARSDERNYTVEADVFDELCEALPSFPVNCKRLHELGYEADMDIFAVDSVISQDLISDASTFIQGELQRLTLDNARGKGEAQSLGERVGLNVSLFLLSDVVSSRTHLSTNHSANFLSRNLGIILERTISFLPVLDQKGCMASDATLYISMFSGKIRRLNTPAKHNISESL